jgi:hypothetical protein
MARRPALRTNGLQNTDKLIHGDDTLQWLRILMNPSPAVPLVRRPFSNHDLTLTKAGFKI